MSIERRPRRQFKEVLHALTPQQLTKEYGSAVAAAKANRKLAYFALGGLSGNDASPAQVGAIIQTEKQLVRLVPSSMSKSRKQILKRASMSSFGLPHAINFLDAVKNDLAQEASRRSVKTNQYALEEVQRKERACEAAIKLLRNMKGEHTSPDF